MLYHLHGATSALSTNLPCQIMGLLNNAGVQEIDEDALRD